MLKEQFEEAKALIQAKKYGEARSLLETINHPRAQEWLQKLEVMEAKAMSRRNYQRGKEWLVLIAILVGIFWLGIGYFALTRFDRGLQCLSGIWVVGCT